MDSNEQIVYHVPALASQSIEGLNINPAGTYVDVTFGGGGHSRLIINSLGNDGRLFGFDQDMDAYANRIDDARFTFVHGNFRYIENFLRYYGVKKVDGILADLGVSFHHFDDGERGFSFRSADAPLDMRMSRDNALDAQKVVNTYDVDRLTDIFRLYGELKNARRMADVIVKSRSLRRIEKIADFLDIIRPLINPRSEKKELAQVFQALRMEVNHEVDALQEFLEQTLHVLRPGARLAIITYHSIEDRMVKNFMRSGRIDGKVESDFFGHRLSPLTLINNKPIIADDEEVERNPRSRSAKLRVAEKNISDNERRQY